MIPTYYLRHIPNTIQLRKVKCKAWTKPKHISLLSPRRSKKSRDLQESPLLSTCSILVCIPRGVSIRTQHCSQLHDSISYGSSSMTCSLAWIACVPDRMRNRTMITAISYSLPTSEAPASTCRTKHRLGGVSQETRQLTETLLRHGRTASSGPGP